MMYSFEKRVSLFFKIAVILAIVLTGQPATGHATSLPGTDIPLIDGARIVKEKQFQGSGRFEFEVDIAPEEAVDFYHQAMQAKGWPAGRIMSVGKNCALMLLHQGDVFSIKAEDKNGRTYVTLAVVLRSSIEKALDPQTAQHYRDAKKPVADPKEKTLPENSNVTIEGTPIGKGDLIRRPKLSGRDGSVTGKKDDGNLPDDPSRPSDLDNPDPEDSSSDDASQPEDVLDVGNDMPERLSVSMHASVRWTVKDPEEYEYTGTINLHFNGNMKIFEKGSPTIHGALGAFKPALTYKAENGTASFNYEERKISLKPIPSGMCQDPLIVEYQGSGVMPLSVESLFKVHRYSSSASPYLQNLSADKQRFLSAFKNNTAVPDYYELMMGPGGSKKRINGRKKDSGQTECAYIPVDRSFPGCRIGIQVELPASGILAGSRTWSADDQGLCPPSLGISIFDIAAAQSKKPLKPPEGGNKNVTYTVSWQIRKGEEYSLLPAEPTDKKKPCEILLNRINTIRINRKLFQNKKLQQYCEEKFGKQDYKSYNAVLEKAASYIYSQEFQTYQEASDFIDSLDPSQIRAIESSNIGDPATCMKTDVVYDDRDNHVVQMQILGYINGNPLPIMEFPYGDFSSARKTGHYDRVREAYGADYFESGAGEIIFDAQIKHELTHARQYLEKGYTPESISEFSDWEQEAYWNELNDLLEKYKKAGC